MSTSLLACEQSLQAVKACLASGADLSERDPSTQATVLMAATMPADVLAFLLEQGADPCAVDQDEQTPLHFCTRKDVAALLLLHGASLDARDVRQRTPLIAALDAARDAREDAELVSLVLFLLEKGADSQAQDELGRTPLHVCRSREIARALIDRGAAVDARCHRNHTPLFHTVSQAESSQASDASSYLDFIAFLLEKGADPLARVPGGETPLHYVSSRAMLEILLKGRESCDVDVVGVSGWTPFHRSVFQITAAKRSQDPEALALLRAWLARGASVRARTKFGFTPLHFCRAKETMELMLERGAEIDARTHMECTPLMCVAAEAAEATGLEALATLLRRGANPNARDDRGNAALHMCSTWEAAEVLLTHGAALGVRNHAGQTPLQCAVSAGGRLGLVRGLLRATCGVRPYARPGQET